MKKKQMLAGTLTVFVLLAFLLFAAALLRQREYPTQKQIYPVMSLHEASRGADTTSEPEPVTSELTDVQPMYTVMDYGGRLAVFTASGGSVPEMITAIETGRMRKTDRDSFLEGVPVFSDEELCSLLEDFGS